MEQGGAPVWGGVRLLGGGGWVWLEGAGVRVEELKEGSLVSEDEAVPSCVEQVALGGVDRVLRGIQRDAEENVDRGKQADSLVGEEEVPV